MMLLGNISLDRTGHKSPRYHMKLISYFPSTGLKVPYEGSTSYCYPPHCTDGENIGREAKPVAQSHPAGQWQSWEASPGLSSPVLARIHLVT